MTLSEINFSHFTELMQSKGVTTLYMKHLAENDNRKNQIYLGPDFSSVQILPNQGVYPDNNNFKSKVDFYWIDEESNLNKAPHAQLILYPDYPEVRLSGLLRGARNAPSDLIAKRLPGRVMFFGICDDKRIIGYVTKFNTPLVKEISDLSNLDHIGVFVNLSVQSQINDERLLLNELRRIHETGWIDSKRLTKAGLMKCKGTNCGGLTLEAELGVVSNSKSEPDFVGYEVKQYNVKDFKKIYSGSAITLMTPEPKGGVYAEEGVNVFVKRYGYHSIKIIDRMDFSGTHYMGKRHARTGLTLKIDGYDFQGNKITNVNGAIKLIADDESVAASWMFSDIIAHWSRKHNRAVYVPSHVRKEPTHQYLYGNVILLAEKTDPLLLFSALVSQKVYYDPGIHWDNISSDD